MMNTSIKAMLALACMAVAAPGVRAEQSVQVIAKDGRTATVPLADVQRIDIGSDAVTIHSASSGEQKTPLADILRINIGVDASAVSSILNEGEIAVWPTQVSSTVNVAGLRPGTLVTVYTSAGTAVASAVASSDGSTSINLTQAAPGMYIVATDGRSVKIIKN